MEGKRLAAEESRVGPEAAALRHCRTNDGGGRIEAKQIGWGGGYLEETEELCIGGQRRGAKNKWDKKGMKGQIESGRKNREFREYNDKM
jgi:hypothetical protein